MSAVGLQLTKFVINLLELLAQPFQVKTVVHLVSDSVVALTNVFVPIVHHQMHVLSVPVPTVLLGQVAHFMKMNVMMAMLALSIHVVFPVVAFILRSIRPLPVTITTPAPTTFAILLSDVKILLSIAMPAKIPAFRTSAIPLLVVFPSLYPALNAKFHLVVQLPVFVQIPTQQIPPKDPPLLPTYVKSGLATTPTLTQLPSMVHRLPLVVANGLFITVTIPTTVLSILAIRKMVTVYIHSFIATITTLALPILAIHLVVASLLLGTHRDVIVTQCVSPIQ